MVDYAPRADKEDSVTLVRVPVESIEKLRDAVAGAQKVEQGLTLRWAIARGLKLVRQELEAHYHSGREFPPREYDPPEYPIREEDNLPRGPRPKPEPGERFYPPES